MSSDRKNADKPTSIRELKKGMKLRGEVKTVAPFGMFVDIGVERDGLMPASEARRIKGISRGDRITVWVKKVDRKRGRIRLTMHMPIKRRLRDLEPGMVVEGVVTDLAPFGAFVDMGAPREGLVHISELAPGYVEKPDDVVSVGEEVEVRVVSVDLKKRQIELSMLGLPGSEESQEEELPTTIELAFREAMAHKSDS